jgi:hypothetical protein
MTKSVVRSLETRTGRPSLRAQRAAAAAFWEQRVSLPPNPPPARRACTVMRCFGRPSTCWSVCWFFVVGLVVEGCVCVWWQQPTCMRALDHNNKCGALRKLAPHAANNRGRRRELLCTLINRSCVFPNQPKREWRQRGGPIDKKSTPPPPGPRLFHAHMYKDSYGMLFVQSSLSPPPRTNTNQSTKSIRQSTILPPHQTNPIQPLPT